MHCCAIVLDWKGKRLTPEQALVVQIAAENFPGSGSQGQMAEFEHALCQGFITCKGNKNLGAFSGTVFHADLGAFDETPWTYEFMLIDGGKRIGDFMSSHLTYARACGEDVEVRVIKKSTVQDTRVQKIRKH